MKPDICLGMNETGSSAMFHFRAFDFFPFREGPNHVVSHLIVRYFKHEYLRFISKSYMFAICIKNLKSDINCPDFCLGPPRRLKRMECPKMERVPTCKFSPPVPWVFHTPVKDPTSYTGAIFHMHALIDDELDGLHVKFVARNMCPNFDGTLTYLAPFSVGFNCCLAQIWSSSTEVNWARSFGTRSHSQLQLLQLLQIGCPVMIHFVSGSSTRNFGRFLQDSEHLFPESTSFRSAVLGDTFKYWYSSCKNCPAPQQQNCCKCFMSQYEGAPNPLQVILLPKPFWCFTFKTNMVNPKLEFQKTLGQVQAKIPTFLLPVFWTLSLPKIPCDRPLQPDRPKVAEPRFAMPKWSGLSPTDLLPSDKGVYSRIATFLEAFLRR